MFNENSVLNQLQFSVWWRTAVVSGRNFGMTMTYMRNRCDVMNMLTSKLDHAEKRERDCNEEKLSFGIRVRR